MRGLWDWIRGAAEKIGFTPAITEAVAVATASPTLSNIQAVRDAYAVVGSSPPPELMQFLYNRYYETFGTQIYPIPGRVTAAVMDWGPWILAGGLLLLVVSRRRR